MSAKQGIISKFKAKNKKAKYKLTYKKSYSQTLKNDRLCYSYSSGTSLSYKGR